MNSAKTIYATIFALLLSGPIAVGAQEETQPVLIYDYAIDHPTEDANMPVGPSIGASVPPTVTIATVDGLADPFYGYFYYEGAPVIVDMTTRSVVRIGH